jgi:hypothetical protein
MAVPGAIMNEGSQLVSGLSEIKQRKQFSQIASEHIRHAALQ